MDKPLKAIRLIEKQDWPASARHVAITLVMRSGDQGCYPTVKGVAERCGMKARTVGMWLRWLKGEDPFAGWKTRSGAPPLEVPFITTTLESGRTHYHFNLQPLQSSAQIESATVASGTATVAAESATVASGTATVAVPSKRLLKGSSKEIQKDLRASAPAFALENPTAEPEPQALPDVESKDSRARRRYAFFCRVSGWSAKYDGKTRKVSRGKTIPRAKFMLDTLTLLPDGEDFKIAVREFVRWRKSHDHLGADKMDVPYLVNRIIAIKDDIPALRSREERERAEQEYQEAMAQPASPDPMVLDFLKEMASK